MASYPCEEAEGIAGATLKKQVVFAVPAGPRSRSSLAPPAARGPGGVGSGFRDAFISLVLADVQGKGKGSPWGSEQAVQDSSRGLSTVTVSPSLPRLGEAQESRVPLCDSLGWLC